MTTFQVGMFMALTLVAVYASITVFWRNYQLREVHKTVKYQAIWIDAQRRMLEKGGTKREMQRHPEGWDA
jgi:hypothetical protein